MFKSIIKMLSFKKKSKQTSTLNTENAKVIPREEHGISRQKISAHAIKVLYRLKKGNYGAYLVGGGVRDLLLGKQPKDFDIATNAWPEQVKSIFRNCRLIGKRFRLAHIFFGKHIIEVATFRSSPQRKANKYHTDEGRVLRDNVYGTIEEDAFRRDFTINALYYNIKDFSVIDFTGGMDDLKNKIIRIIGNPEERYREDPVRMLRAIRFASKLDFGIEEKTAEPIKRLGSLLLDIPAARRFDEFEKLFFEGYAGKVFTKLYEYDLLKYLFPAIEEQSIEESKQFMKLMQAVLASTDERVLEKKTASPAFIISGFLWHHMCKRVEKHEDEGMERRLALDAAIEECLRNQAEIMSIPRYLAHAIRDTWLLQFRFHFQKGRRFERMLNHRQFRMAYDFLQMREAAGEPVSHYVKWWGKYKENIHSIKPAEPIDEV